MEVTCLIFLKSYIQLIGPALVGYCEELSMTMHWFISLNYSVTSPLGHIYLRDMSTILSSVEGTPLFGKRTFWVPKPGFNLHSEDILAVKKLLTIKSIDKFKVLDLL